MRDNNTTTDNNDFFDDDLEIHFLDSPEPGFDGYNATAAHDHANHAPERDNEYLDDEINNGSRNRSDGSRGHSNSEPSNRTGRGHSNSEPGNRTGRGHHTASFYGYDDELFGDQYVQKVAKAGKSQKAKDRKKKEQAAGTNGGRRRITAGRVAAIIFITLAALVVAALIAWRVMSSMGRTALYAEAQTTSQAPTLNQAAVADNETNSTDGAAEDAGETWQEGWVRYKGDVYAYNEDIITFLIMGIDNNGVVQPAADGISGGQSDALFLLILNPDTKKISVFAIDRNTMTEIEVFDKAGNSLGKGIGQICLQHGYGDGMQVSCERTVTAVSNLMYNLPIHGYVSINMGAIPTINDAVGGVTVPRMTLNTDGSITYGDDETLYGQDAYNYVHWRDMYTYGTAAFRLEKQKAYLKAFMQKAMARIRRDPTSVVNLYNQISPYMVTSVTTTELTYLATEVAGYTLDIDEIYSLKGTTRHAEDAKTGHEEFEYDEDALFDSMIQLFYQKVDTEK